MRTLRTFLCLQALALWLTSAAQRQVENADADWLFPYKEATEKPVKGIPPQAQVGYDDAGWKSVSVPHTWQTYETTGELHPFIASLNVITEFEFHSPAPRPKSASGSCPTDLHPPKRLSGPFPEKSKTALPDR